MRKLNDSELHILSVVEKHGHICIGLPVDAQWAPIAEALARLAKWKFLVLEPTDDGPRYSLSPAGRDRLS